MKKLLSLALVMALAPSVPASDLPISLGPLTGAAASVVVDPQDDLVLLATLSQAGLLRSTDGGQSFAPFGSGLPSGIYRSLVRDPKNQNRVLLIANNEAWHSLDFGLTWTSLGLVDSSLRKLAISTTTNDIFAASGASLYHSSNNGGSWTTAATGLLINEVVISTSAPSNILYGSINGLFRSTDNGATFNTTALGSWTKAAAFQPTNPNVILAGTTNSIFRSSDGGASFTKITQGLPSLASVRFFEPSPGSDLWLALLDGMWVSQDNGLTWTDSNAGLGAQPPIPTGLSFNSLGDAFMSAESSGGGIWRTVGQQVPWKHLAFPTATSFTVAFAGTTRISAGSDGVYATAPAGIMSPTMWQFDFGSHTEAVLVDDSDPTRWVTGGVGAFIDNAQIVVLTGNGQNVNKTYELSGAGRVTTIERNPANSNELLAGIFPGGFGANAIISSIDNGLTWTPVVGTAGWANRAITFDPFTPGRVLQQSDNGQWSESLDSGATWNGLQTAFPTAGPAMLLAFDPTRAGTIYRGDTGTGLHRSDDNGATWTSLGVSLDLRSEIQFTPDASGTFWVSSANGTVQVTGDFGATFSTAFNSPLAAPCTALDLDLSTGDLLIGTDGASTWEVPHASPYIGLGGGTQGSGGRIPNHFAVGDLPKIGSLSFGYGGSNAVGGAIAVMATSLVSGNLPVFGGTLHPISPYLTFTAHNLSGAVGVPGDGSFSATFGIPANVSLIGLQLFSQLAVLGDAGAVDPSGFVLSGGLKTTLVP